MKNKAIKITIIGVFLILLISSFNITLGSNIHFKREKNVNCFKFLKLPPNLKKGDIFFCDTKDGFNEGYSNDHCGIYLGYNLFIHAAPRTPYYFGPYKGDTRGVVITHKFLLNLYWRNITFGYVTNATKAQREGVVKWALSQWGKPYQWSVRRFDNFQSDWACPNPEGVMTDPYGNTFVEEYPDYWYCSEFVWAAYLSQSEDLDLGSVWFEDYEKGCHHCIVWPGTIRDDEDVTLYPEI